VSVGGVVLAAGEGRRFGGPKQLAELDGRPLVHHAVRALLDTPGVDEVVVVLGARADDVAPVLADLPVRVVVAHDWQQGNAASLRAGVAALPDADAVVVVLGDQPRVTARVVEGALAAARDGRAVRTTYAGEPGHPVVLPRRLLAAVGELRGDEGARRLLADATTFEAGRLCDPSDIDTPEDLEAMRA
jgi:nicotine blue oxidoreductase